MNIQDNLKSRFAVTLTILGTLLMGSVTAEGPKSKSIQIGSKALTEGVILAFFPRIPFV